MSETRETLRVCRVRPGRVPGEWEIIDAAGDLIAVRFGEEEALAFADGFNLGVRQVAS